MDGSLCHLGALQEQGRKFDIIDQLTWLIVLEWHALSQCFADRSVGEWRCRPQHNMLLLRVLCHCTTCSLCICQKSSNFMAALDCHEQN